MSNAPVLSEFQSLFPELLSTADDIAALCTRVPITSPTVMFCMTARVGSTALTSVLHKNLNFCYIEEIFNGRDVANVFKSKFQLQTFVEYITFVQRSYKKYIFAFKTCWTDFAFLTQASAYKVLFPNTKFIFLDRIDIEAQAISLYAAAKTGKWHREKGSSQIYPTQIEFSKDEIDRVVWQLLDAKLSWAKFFCENQISPLVIHYETFVDNPAATIEQICQFVGVPISQQVDWSTGSLEKISSPATEDLLWRYRAARYPSLNFGGS